MTFLYIFIFLIGLFSAVVYVQPVQNVLLFLIRKLSGWYRDIVIAGIEPEPEPEPKPETEFARRVRRVREQNAKNDRSLLRGRLSQQNPNILTAQEKKRLRGSR